jgi:hypothetical protein
VSIALRCPQCGTINQVDIAAAQVAVACTGCQVQLRMPRATSAPRVEPPPEYAPLGAGYNPFAEQSPPVVAKEPVETFNPYQSPAAIDVAPKRLYGGHWAPGQDPRLASRGKRFVGALIDTGLVLAAFFIGMFTAEAGRGQIEAKSWMGLVVLGIVIPQVVLISIYGQSLGKMFVNTRIHRVDNDQPVGFLHGVLLRMIVPALVQMVPCVGGLFPWIDALYIFGEERRCLHDLMAGTKVLDNELTRLYQP